MNDVSQYVLEEVTRAACRLASVRKRSGKVTLINTQYSKPTDDCVVQEAQLKHREQRVTDRQTNRQTGR